MMNTTSRPLDGHSDTSGHGSELDIQEACCFDNRFKVRRAFLQDHLTSIGGFGDRIYAIEQALKCRAIDTAEAFAVRYFLVEDIVEAMTWLDPELRQLCDSEDTEAFNALIGPVRAKASAMLGLPTLPEGLSAQDVACRVYESMVEEGGK